jgi:hypothetical protein
MLIGLAMMPVFVRNGQYERRSRLIARRFRTAFSANLQRAIIFST